MRNLLIFIGVLFVASCASAREDKSFFVGSNADKNIGWLHGKCLAIKNTNVPKQSDVTLILLGGSQSMVTGKITGKAKSGKQCYALLEDRRKINVEAGYSFYLVDTNAKVDLGIGVLGDVTGVSNYQFSYCTTEEGVPFSVTKNGVGVWNGYYYLGYDAEATCKSD